MSKLLFLAGPVLYSKVFTAKEFGGVRLVCDSTDLATLIQWKFAGVEIFGTRHPYKLGGRLDQFLDIANVTREHAGVYECWTIDRLWNPNRIKFTGNQTLVVDCTVIRICHMCL